MLDGDEWVINGQKVWTTGGHHADYCFLLTRTDPEAPKHKGISYLLVPMRQPGVEVRGITQPDGTAEFCEVFFTDARCPKDNVVGGVNNGWKVANSTLGVRARPVGDDRLPALRGGVPADGRRRPRRTGRSTTRTSASGSLQYYTKIQILRFNGLRIAVGDAVRVEGHGRRSRSARRTRCSGRRCTSGRWSWRSTSTAPTRCSIDTGPAPAARGRARCATSAATAIR